MCTTSIARNSNAKRIGNVRQENKMTDQPDFFGGVHTVQIKDNAVLERACNRLLNMIKDNPSLLDGDTVGTVDRRIYAELLWEDCFKTLIAQEKKSVFINAMLKAPEGEVYSRARRELQNRDLIRLSANAIRSSENFRNRIAGAMK